ncbi:hypothetical protein NPIL_24891 [Nephila pilipes]|uniref:Uncharacterized protein n=1 Tax=Nephila pilipes TaxID=299642 RepID=A0A8X6NNM0_NEPPI|nr:hypothetical protein NPIL_24891 [Nephila pilipes]
MSIKSLDSKQGFQLMSEIYDIHLALRDCTTKLRASLVFRITRVIPNVRRHQQCQGRIIIDVSFCGGTGEQIFPSGIVIIWSSVP